MIHSFVRLAVAVAASAWLSVSGHAVEVRLHGEAPRVPSVVSASAELLNQQVVGLADVRPGLTMDWRDGWFGVDPARAPGSRARDDIRPLLLRLATENYQSTDGLWPVLDLQ